MHPAARHGFARMMAGCWHHLPAAARVLDLGGADVNGTIHDLIRSQLTDVTIDVLDLADGPGVTIVADARNYRPAPDAELYDLVISTECLEHVFGWPLVVKTARACLEPGGWFVGTAASIGRRPHGARGEHDVPEGEHYDNVDPSKLASNLAVWFDGPIRVIYDRDPQHATTHDVYWRARAGA